MATNLNAVELDLAALQAEIEKLTPEEIAQQVLAVRTQQRVNQKKHQNAGAQRVYMAKRNARIKLMTELLKKNGAYEGILAQANAAAEAKLAADSTEVEPIGDEAELSQS
jgi:hypothetical protein